MSEYKTIRFIDTVVGIPLCIFFGILTKLRDPVKRIPSNNTPQNVLVISPPAIGDAVLLIPSLRAIRKHFPALHIRLIAYPINEEIFRNCPYVDEIVSFQYNAYLRNPLTVFPFLRKLRKIQYDLAIDFGQWLRTSALIAYFSSARRRTGFETQSQYRHYPLTEVVSLKADCHIIECFFDLVRILDIEVVHSSLEMFVDPSDTEFADKMLTRRCERETVMIGVHPGGPVHGELRKWDVKKFAILCDRLVSKYNAEIIFTGDGKDSRQVDSIMNLMKHQAITLAGKTSLNQLAALIKKCRLFICGNTGAMHISAAVNTPVVALHGPTDPKRWGPLGKNHAIVQKDMPCVPCLSLGWEYGCKTGDCIHSITVDDVMEAVEEVLGY